MEGILNGKGRDWNGAEMEASPPGEDDGEWVDEEEDGEEDDLLDLEFHPSYVSNPQRRRRRFDTRWDALVQAVSPSFNYVLFCFDSHYVRIVPSSRPRD